MSSNNNLSSWLMEGIDAQSLAETNLTNSLGGISTLAYSDSYATSDAYSEYDRYSVYYPDYSVYYNNSVSIVTNPVSQVIELGNSVTFTIAVSNSSLVTAYQWYIANSNTDTGTAISGATSASYQFTPSVSYDGKYFYCVVTYSGGTVISSRATLTVKSLKAYDIYLLEGKTMDLFIKMSPSSSTIQQIISNDSSIVSVNNSTLTGVSVGNTTVTINSSNGMNKTINVNVLLSRSTNELEALFKNLAIAIKASKNINIDIKPDQMYNILNTGSTESKIYNNLGEIFIDIASLIKVDSSQKLYPKEFYHAILNKYIQ